MHTSELVELAALLATHARTIIHLVDEFPRRAVESYWSASKCRQERWARALKNHSSNLSRPDESLKSNHWRSLQGVLEEILMGEVLTRIWCGISSAHDRRRGTNETEPVAHSVLVGHLEARHRALTMMVRGRECGVEEAVELNRLRRRSERWTDLLLGRLAKDMDVSQLAFDAHRARDFAAEDEFGQSDGIAWQLMLTSLRAAFQSGVSDAAPNADLNRQIAESILACLPSDLFDSTGLFKSLWLSRLDRTTHETQGMIDEYLALDQGYPHSSRRADFERRRL